MFVTIRARIGNCHHQTSMPPENDNPAPAPPTSGAVKTAAESPHDPAAPIAVFDSGVGGLTVLHELLVQLPAEDFLYLGDTANFPYGDRTAAELQAFSVAIADHLLAQGAKLLVVACNSASAAALETLEHHLALTSPQTDVIGVLGPAAQLAVVASRSGRIGLLATPATVANGAYARAIRAADPHVHLESVACPDLARIIQSGFPFDEGVVETVRAYCAPLIAAEVDTVILGSTHYPLCAPILQRMLGRSVSLVSAGAGVARSVERALSAKHLLNPRAGEGEYRFQCTGDVASFKEVGMRFLQLPFGEVDHVGLDAKVAA
jgi:glutamate racemase